MARVTVENCLEQVSDDFQLVLIAAQRTRELLSGALPAVALRNDKEDIIALREIAEGKLNMENIVKNLMYTINKVTPDDLDTDSTKDSEKYMVVEENEDSGKQVINTQA